MASLPLSLNKTLAYFDKYDYPLTPSELYFWQHGTKYSKKFIEHCALSTEHCKLRIQREVYSKKKWLIAKQMGEQLKKFPSIAAIFVTGALAMNNCPANDDIDLMIVTYPNTLWLTRFFVVIYLKFLGVRRYPASAIRQPTTENRICDNLWLDSNHLVLHNHSIYIAHEILQAKVLWDRASIHHQFITQNSWVKKYLPVAYLSLLELPSPKLGEGSRVRYWVLWLLNLLFFLMQYLYMKPKMTSEKVGPGFAFFHPSK